MARRHLLVLRAQFRRDKTDVPEEIASKIKKAGGMIDLVEREKSRGGHNFAYSKALIAEADDYLLGVKKWYARKSSSR